MKKIKLGTIGSGPIVHSILENTRNIPEIELISIYSRSKEKAEKLANIYNAKEFHIDLESFISSPNINTVYIASPNSLHFEQSKLALEHGKNVICEKPFVPTYREAKELIALADQFNLFIIEAAPTSFLPNLDIIKNNLSKLGHIKLVLANYSQFSSRYNKLLSGNKPNIFNPEFAGGCLMDINYYNILLNVLLFGKANKTNYYANIYPQMADTSGIAILEYPDFISTNIGAKDCSGKNFFLIEGEKGYIYAHNGANGLNSIETVIDGKSEIMDKQGGADRLYFELIEIAYLFINKRSDIIKNKLLATLETVAMIEEMRLAVGITFPSDK